MLCLTQLTQAQRDAGGSRAGLCKEKIRRQKPVRWLYHSSAPVNPTCEPARSHLL